MITSFSALVNIVYLLNYWREISCRLYVALNLISGHTDNHQPLIIY
ncbi:hypothetical protein BALOs_2917 [Halobacteriovorax sp. BALOs_7]|nr:hypothetical protein BALOs_2917 [Halobacteriovorax sp. BALOs_7]